MQDLISSNPSRLELFMRLTDVLALVLAGELVGRMHFQSALIDAAPIHTVLLYFCSGVATLVFMRLEIYVSWRGRKMPQLVLRLAFAWGLALFVGIVFGFLIHQAGALSRLWMFYWFWAGLVLLVLARLLAFSVLMVLRQNGLNGKRVIIVGYGEVGREMQRRAAQQEWFGYEVLAVQADAADLAELQDPAITRLAELDDVPIFASAHDVHEIWITLPMSASSQLGRLQYLLRNALLDIRWIPDTMSMQILSSRMVDFLGFPAVELNRPASSGLNGLLKDSFDRVFALAALVLMAPLMLGIALAIKLSSPGPVLFRQPRLGLNGKPFQVYKFRSMQVHQEHGGITQAQRNDARIFKVGQFLRRTSLDELPQFFNVLLGHMSVVGPRPHALHHNAMYQDLLELYMLRHRVKPGITGWAQIHGYRGETDTVDKMADRVRFDLYYIQHWSLWMDLRIIVWTALKGWTGKNAY
jgi:putative colanic acid biosynthesis UDP-glucose lipid carrier transferase